MHTVSRTTFATIKTEGAILPADLLQRIADGAGVDGLRPEDYHLLPGERINEAINRAWNRCLGVWQRFDDARANLPESDSGITLTRERWLLVLFQELGYGRLPHVGNLSLPSLPAHPVAPSPTYPISHVWGQTPIHLVSFRQDLDRRDPTTKRSPHSLMQEFLNRSEGHLWGLVSNGLRLRVLRDNVSLTRAAYLEFDLEATMRGELYADFSLLWLVCHQSRVEARDGGDAGACWLETWSQAAAEQGARALDALRQGVQEAIAALGRGFLAHPANRALKARLKTGELSAQDYYRQLLRLVYRLIFLFVAEERDLLLVQDDTGTGRQGDKVTPLPGHAVTSAPRHLYDQYYSLRRLRDLAEARRGGPHPDLYRTLRLLFTLLREGYAPLGLPALGSFLFSERCTPELDQLDLANAALLDAVRALAFTVEGNVRRPVDYGNLGAEELGSVYESLLELHPRINADAGAFALDVAAGSERKTTGSYYTPTSLIQSLLDSALEPVVEDRVTRWQGDTVTSLPPHPVIRSPITVSPQEAILSIRVVDPACGSGHFLIAAAHRLARHLARARTGDAEPAPAELRAALRDVVRHCIHGVDINPMAVELCKVALWMETLDPGKPLGFLDRNIQCGNSLIGATPALLREGIPDAAFEPIAGDDKACCSRFRKKNHAEREGQLSLFSFDMQQPWNRLGDLAASMAGVLGVGEETLDDVRQAQTLYQEMVQSSAYEYGRLWADAWCAAFVWKKTDEFPYPITEEVFRRIERSPFDLAPWMRDEIQRLAGQYQFFHWHLAFPHIFTAQPPEGLQLAELPEPSGGFGWVGGFDVVLGNPPWEMLELSEKEFFAPRAPDIAEAPTARQRQKLIEALDKENSTLYSEFIQAKRSVYASRLFIQKSERFPLSSVGRINLYPLFVETAITIQNNDGRTGIIVPSAISMDAYNADLFSWLINNRRLVSLFDFENRRAIFDQVHRGYRFCLLTLCGANVSLEQLEFCYYILDPVELRDSARRVNLTPAEIRHFSPNTLAPPILLNATDTRLAKAVYSKFGVLVNRKTGENPWQVSIQRMLSLSDPGDIFRKITELDESEIIDSQRWMRLYSGKAIHQFDHRYATYAANSWRDSNLLEHADSKTVIRTEYYARTHEVLKRIGDKQPNRWLLAYRDVTNATNERTAIAAILPRVGCDTTSRNIYSNITPSFLCSLQANLNNFAFDYFARQKVIGMHLNAGVLEQLPVLPPAAYDQPCPWAGADDVLRFTFHAFILPRVLELTYTAWDLLPFAQDVFAAAPHLFTPSPSHPVTPSPFIWDEARRFLLRCELDAAYFHLYEIAREDVDYIMETFPIVKRKDEAAHGEYRTKRVILEIYDEMARAMETGEAYRTRLDPPPADPRVAHEGGSLL